MKKANDLADSIFTELEAQGVILNEQQVNRIADNIAVLVRSEIDAFSNRIKSDISTDLRQAKEDFLK
jgi:hypothetical protein